MFVNDQGFALPTGRGVAFSFLGMERERKLSSYSQERKRELSSPS